MAAFIFFATTAWARVVAAYFGACYHRCTLYLRLLAGLSIVIFFIGCIILACRVYLGFVYTHLAHVSRWLRPAGCLWRCILYGYACAQQEGDDVAVSLQHHLLKQIEGFKLIDQQWV